MGGILTVSYTHLDVYKRQGFYFNSDNIIILPDEVCDNLDFIETNFVANIENKMKYEEANEFRQNYIYN